MCESDIRIISIRDHDIPNLSTIEDEGKIPVRVDDDRAMGASEDRSRSIGDPTFRDSVKIESEIWRTRDESAPCHGAEGCQQLPLILT